jgi:hypothetical protein
MVGASEFNLKDALFEMLCELEIELYLKSMPKFRTAEGVNPNARDEWNILVDKIQGIRSLIRRFL